MLSSSTRTITLVRTAALVALAGAALGCGRDAAGPGASDAQPADTRAARYADYSAWSPAVSVELAPPGAHSAFNTEFVEGCPLTSRDGKSFFLASTRPDGLGGIDIWVSKRESVRDPWGPPVNVGAPVNSSANDFCPMLARDGHTFYFVSNRPGGCGGADIYVTRFRGGGRVDEPENLGCDVNSAADEAGPVPLNEPGRGPVLYFSSLRPGGVSPEVPGAAIGDSDLYASESHGGVFGPAALVPGVNTEWEEGQPYVRADARELYFYSNRPGTLGGNDIYVSTRERSHAPWSMPVNLGPNVNGAAAETRPSLSWDGATLYFGSTREGGDGMSDIYAATRRALTGGDD